MKLDYEMLCKMRHSPLHNYVIPGLTSWIVGPMPGPHGGLRMFECSRNHEEQIIPHSHRFDFQAQVLRGSVFNKIWWRTENLDADTYAAMTLRYRGLPGEYTTDRTFEVGRWNHNVTKYLPGDVYFMRADQIHSIQFSRGAAVLFFEGPTTAETSQILQPAVDGNVIETFKVEPWMFQR